MPTTSRSEAIEPGRLMRALRLTYDKVGPRQYLVIGNSEPFYAVDLDAEIPCTCKDTEYNGTGRCKHVLRCLIVERHPAVFDQVLKLYERRVVAEREAADARRAMRTRRAKAGAA